MCNSLLEKNTMNAILELFGVPEKKLDTDTLKKILVRQNCPFTNSRCFKVRKSQPDVSIGTCTVNYGKENKQVIICPRRLLQKNQVFCDCIHLLTLHDPGNEFHIVPEITVPGGSIDFFFVSVKNGKVKDFVAVEFQTMDTIGTVWPLRQRILNQYAIQTEPVDINSGKSFAMNWKMTAKTTLVQLHHKIKTIEKLGKHMVFITQDHLLKYMQQKFCLDHLSLPGKVGDSLHFHAYSLLAKGKNYTLNLESRLSTDAAGVATCLGLQTESNIEMAEILQKLEQKISDKTLMTL
jgi:hypothetical protein